MKRILPVAGALLAACVCAAPAAQNAVPGLGEIMALQQMRHAKLWMAGRNRNWALAGYELDELREGFEDARKFHPEHDKIPVSALIERFTSEPLRAIGKALDAGRTAEFEKSFDALTAACNACHRAANHGFIVIARPRGAMYGNQVFTKPRTPGSRGN